MSAPEFLRNNYSDLYGSSQLPVLEELFRSEFDRFPMIRERLFRVIKHDRDIYQSSELHDLQLLAQMGEGEEYTMDRQRQGASKTLSVLKYGLGFSISQEAVADGKFDYIADALRKLGKSAAESQEIQAMNIFNNGFSTETTADGVSVFNSAHTQPRGGTYSNVLATAADLSVTSFEQMLLDFETNFVGDTGIYEKIMPKCLLVHPSNKRYARELLGSSGKPDSADNNMNSFQGELDEVISSVHLTDTDAWFMLAAPSENGLRIISRAPVETAAGGEDVGFFNDSIYYKTRYREIVGALHAKGVFGTAGA